MRIKALNTITTHVQKRLDRLVRDDSKLLDDGKEISKSEGKGWRFDSQL